MTFLVYVLLGNPLTADKVFFALPIFNIVIHNMVSTLPSAAAGIGELIVATNRIEVKNIFHTFMKFEKILKFILKIWDMNFLSK